MKNYSSPKGGINGICIHISGIAASVIAMLMVWVITDEDAKNLRQDKRQFDRVAQATGRPLAIVPKVSKASSEGQDNNLYPRGQYGA